MEDCSMKKVGNVMRGTTPTLDGLRAMSDINKQQSSVGQNQQQQSPTQQHPQLQQSQVEGQTVQVQMSQDGTEQMQGSQVASSNATLNSSSSMVMAAPQQTLLSQQAMQNMSNPPALTPIPPSQAGSAAITTMSTGPPQQMAEWPGHGRVQVIQQPIQNPTYIQPVYNTQGQLMVPGNIALHPGGMNQPIQVIAAGKAFQPGQMPVLTTAQGKQIVQGQAASFPGYTTIPTSGNNQTLVISQLGVLGQTNILPQQQGKPQEMQKIITKNNIPGSNMNSSPSKQQNVSIANLVSSQPQGLSSQAQTIIQPQILSPIQYTCNTQQPRTVPQSTAQTMQFTPWQATFGPTGLPQGLTWAPGAIQGSTLLTQGNQIFIRNPQPDQPGMFIQNTQPSVIPQHNQLVGQQMNKTNQATDMGGNVQPKTAVPKTFSTILPNPLGPPQLRPASSVSTQTGQTQAVMQQGSFQSLKAGAKVRTKNVCRMPSMATSPKSDQISPVKSSASIQILQPKVLVSNAQAGTPEKIKPNQSSNHTVQVQQQQQPVGQIQIQNVFQEPADQKPPGQVVVTNGIQNGGDRNVMPVVPMPPGQITSVMGNMILQTVPGITTGLASGITIPPGQPNISIAQEIVGMPGAVALTTPIKQDNVGVKNQENGGTETGPGRPGVESVSEVKEPDGDVKDRSQLDDTAQGNEKSTEEGDKKGDTGQTKATMMVKPQVLTHVIEGFVIQESSEPFPVNRTVPDGLIKKLSMNDSLENGEPPAKKPMMEEKAEDDANKVNPMKWTVAEVCEFIRNLPGCAEYVDDFAMQDIDGEALMLLKADHLMSAMSMKLGPAVKIIAKIDTMRVNTAPKESP